MELERREWVLAAESELRCEVPADATLTVQLLEGNAEIFGIELAVSVGAPLRYRFKGKNVAVFSWYGCKLETYWTDAAGHAYMSNETPMVSYVNTHAQLEARRDVALGNSEAGPRVMVVGQTDSGKSTLCRILAAYAARLGRTPILADLDVGQNGLTIPGCVAAVPLEINSLSVEDGFEVTAPLVFYYGDSSPSQNPTLYKHCITNLAQCINDRLQRDPEANASGLIVNTCGWVDKQGYQLLLHSIEALSIDVLLVMGHDRLYADLKRDMAANNVVIKLPRSGGVVQRDMNVRRSTRSDRVKEYFYGNPLADRQFAPSRLALLFQDVVLFRVPAGSELSEELLPIGFKGSQGQLQVMTVDISQQLMHRVLAVLHVDLDPAQPRDEEELQRQVLEANATGFVYVTDVDMEKNMLELLAPCRGDLPSRCLLLGSDKLGTTII